MEEEFKPLSQSDELERELAQIQWYINHKQWIQAVTLSREWLISLFAQTNNVSREAAEAEELHKALQAPQQTPAYEMALEFRSLSDFRNDLAHCGKRNSPRGPAKIEKTAQDLPARLRELLKMSRV